MALSEREIKELLPYLDEDERREMDQLLASGEIPIWAPLPGPQSLAYLSEADVIGYGGAAGGGKSDLAIGKALTCHEKTMIVRLNGTELTGVIDRMAQILGTRDGFNGQDKIWRLGPDNQVEFGSVPNPGDESKYQGRPHDLLVFDEATNIPANRVRFLMGWNRTTTPGQRCQTLLTFNPPTDVEGRWVIDFFGPWLDPKHPCPAEPGELRWFATIEGKDLEVIDASPFVMVDGEKVFDFDPKAFKPEEIIQPKSRTFIPAKIGDNPHLLGTGYMATLQALPEPLRSQMLKGDFNAGMTDDPWQVIPTAWVEIAQARWKDLQRKPPMDSLGVDVARGGKDNTVIYRRHGMWFDRALCFPGKETPDGPTTAGLVVGALRDHAPIHIDVIGVGSSPYDFLRKANQQVIGVNVASGSQGTDKSGKLTFLNLRSELWWRLREALDPNANNGIALPPDRQLLIDLCTPKWGLSGMTVKVQSREEIVKEIGRSPDYASALCLALIDTPKKVAMEAAYGAHKGYAANYDPFAMLER